MQIKLCITPLWRPKSQCQSGSYENCPSHTMFSKSPLYQGLYNHSVLMLFLRAVEVTTGLHRNCSLIFDLHCPMRRLYSPQSNFETEISEALTLSQTTNFRLFHTQILCRRQF